MEPYIHKVQYYETDQMQVTHHSNYIRFMEEARVDFFEKLGSDYRRVEEGGVYSPVVRVSCDFKKTTRFGDCIEITLRVVKVSPVRLVLDYEMRVEGETVCTGRSEHCFLDAGGHFVNIKERFPALYLVLSEG